MNLDKWTNKGTLSGIATILTGIAAVYASVTGQSPEIVVSLIAIISGVITTRDSINARKTLPDSKPE